MSTLPPHRDASPPPSAQLSVSNDPVSTEKKRSDHLVSDTNALLSKMGFGDRAFANAADLVASVSSMSVALYEKLFQFRLRNVERVPRTRQDYEHNAQVVADALRGALLEQSNDGDTVDELTGQRLCAGDLGSIRRLLMMLEQVYTLLFEESHEVGERLRDVSLASLGMDATATEQDVRLHRIAIGLEARNEEEKQLRHAMNHLLDLEKEKLREEHRLTTSVLKQIQKEHAEREQAMENFYANQIQLVKEQTRREAKERELVEKAQRSASEKMMRELRHDRENELTRLLQEKQHLEETRRFRHTSQMTQLLEKTEEHSARRTDAFYTAAMKARERHTVNNHQHIQRRTSLKPYRTSMRRSTTRLATSTLK
ncbi:hypothetical protein PHMEG_00010659 [Phytophthora megakarya]|uniref:DUF5745 domain-containing protein n=1 Tax=Phytophthora megakarya TaxID=4795 RepID=A0A225WD56_9STRA|nr:hypothetical protein PHMEG_00010659 [Phytophthora megakarya]